MTYLKKLTILAGISTITSCSFTTTNIEGGAYIVESTRIQNPIQGAYLEIQYTTDEGGSYDILATTTTDENGYFYFDEKSPDCFDCWERVDVYSDSTGQILLGSFEFVSANFDNIFSPDIIHVDTFSLEHTIYAVPRMDSLPTGDYSNLSYAVTSFPLASGVASNYSVSGPIQIGDQFNPIELIMSFQTQHWIQYGYGQIAQTSILNSQNQEINGGFFLKTPDRYTAQGDTVYLEYRPRD
jgi:hypothetical protein